MRVDHEAHRPCRRAFDRTSQGLTFGIAATRVDHGDTAIADNKADVRDSLAVKHHGVSSRAHIDPRGDLDHLGGRFTRLRR